MQGWKRIQNYQFSLKKLIGEGSYASVYLGKSIQTGQNVAVKVIDKKIFLNAYNLKNIQSEIDIMKMVDHQNIVKLHDIYQTTNNMYIITEFCQDGDLYHYLEKKQKLPESQAKKYLKHIMKGAKYLHSNGIIHRDLKPANILMKGDCCKISDFGFAKSLEDENTIMKSIVGTPLYMSPQILKKTKYTTKSDLWSIGLIYYEMLHGKTPWPATNEMQLLNGIYTRKPTFSKDVSETSKDFIKKCLQIHQDERIGWEQAFQHRLIKQNKQIRPKQSFLKEEQKENYSTNLSQYRHKNEENNYLTHKPKKDLSQKVLEKLQNYTPSRKGTRTPKNITPGKNNATVNTTATRIKNVLAITPKKDKRKTLTGKKVK